MTATICILVGISLGMWVGFMVGFVLGSDAHTQPIRTNHTNSNK